MIRKLCIVGVAIWAIFSIPPAGIWLFSFLDRWAIAGWFGWWLLGAVFWYAVNRSVGFIDYTVTGLGLRAHKNPDGSWRYEKH